LCLLFLLGVATVAGRTLRLGVAFVCFVAGGSKTSRDLGGCREGESGFSLVGGLKVDFWKVRVRLRGLAAVVVGGTSGLGDESWNLDSRGVEPSLGAD
jgi:hypothetical protein